MNSLTIRDHPCYGSKASHKFGRIHLPVAPKCNIVCNYCSRDYHCVNESRVGVCSQVLSPDEALARTMDFVARNDNVSVIGIAGPGDPLANEETFTTLEMIHAAFPHLLKCLSTNGLLLPEKIGFLNDLGVRALTVTVNAGTAVTAANIYSNVEYHGRTYRGMESARLLLANQIAGIREAVRLGIDVKINTVLIPRVNDHEIVKIALTVKALGVGLINIMPLIPLGLFASYRPPTAKEMNLARKQCGELLTVLKHCQRCRADAAGMIRQRGIIKPKPYQDNPTISLGRLNRC